MDIKPSYFVLGWAIDIGLREHACLILHTVFYDLILHQVRGQVSLFLTDLGVYPVLDDTVLPGQAVHKHPY